MKLLIGLVALVLALGFAASVSQSAPRPAPNPDLWAVVNVDGSLARGHSAVSSAQLGVDGQYEVVFNRDVSGCAYVATAGEATTFGADDAVTFGVSSSQSGPAGVFLIEYDAILARDAYSSGFHLIVSCP